MTEETNNNNNTPATTGAAKRRRNRKKKNKKKNNDNKQEEERQKQLEFSKMNNHAKLRNDLIVQGFSAEQIDAAMDAMWNQNLPYDEYDQVLKYLKEGNKKPATEKTTGVQKITESDDKDDGVEETKIEGAMDSLTPSQVVAKVKTSPVKASPKRAPPKSNLNSMAARLDLVAGFDNLADAIFAMTEWIIQSAKPNELEELCASVETVALSKIIRRSIIESTQQSEFDNAILPSMVRLLENLLQKCGMPASRENSFPSILQQARKVYQMKKAGSEGVPQRVAEFMVARMYVILKESSKLSQQSSGLDAIKPPPSKASNKDSKKGFAQIYSERETHRIVAKQFGAAALSSCRSISSSTSSAPNAKAMEAAKTDIFAAIIDEDTNAAFHQHESMYTELKAQATEKESEEENNATLEALKGDLAKVQTQRQDLATKIATLQQQISELETQDQALVAQQFKIQEQMDHEQDQQSDETKKLNEALKEASIQLQSDEYVKSLVDLLKDFDDALAARSVQAISQAGNTPQENASKAMDFYLQRAKNYFASEANLFQLLQKRIVTNQTKVSEMKRDIEMCQGLGMTTTINQMEEDIQAGEIMVTRDKALVSRIRSESSAMLDELMVWLEEYNTAHDKDPKVAPISDKIIQAIPAEVSKLEIPNGDRLDAFLAIHDIVHLQPPSLDIDLSQLADEEEAGAAAAEETEQKAAPKFTWAMSPTNVATKKTAKSFLDIQKEEMESKKEEEEKVEAVVEEKVTPEETAKEAAEPEATVTKAEETKPEEEPKKEPEKAATSPEPSAKPEEKEPPKEETATISEPSTMAEPAAPAEPLASPTETPAATSDDVKRDPLVFPCFLEPPTGTTLSMPFAPFQKEDNDKDIDLGDYVKEETKGQTKASNATEKPSTTGDFSDNVLVQKLNDFGLKYQVYAHVACKTADELVANVPLPSDKETHTKNLFFKDKKHGMFLVTHATSSTFNTKQLGALLKLEGKVNMRLADATLLDKHLKAEPGHVGPLCIVNDESKEVKLILDKALMDYEIIHSHPAKNDASVKLTPSVLQEFMTKAGVEPTIVDFTATPQAPAPQQQKGEKQQGGGKQQAKQNKKTAKKGDTLLALQWKKSENFAQWYSDVIVLSEMISYYDISGCYILRPWSYKIWHLIQKWFNEQLLDLDVKNCYFPLFVSQDRLEKEKDHVEGFAPEVAWVTKSGESDLAKQIAIRPTSETIMYPAFADWIKSHRDLPLKLNQWSNVVRWEFKDPTPFLRSREFLWQEGHTAHASYEDADKMVMEALDLYKQVYQDLLCVPVVPGYKTEKEKFAGGHMTTTVEAYIAGSGRAIQGATSHNLGQNFGKMFDIKYQDETGETKIAWQTSWGLTTRTIGVMVMVHGDDKGLVMPPKVSPLQCVIVPIISKKLTAEVADPYCKSILKDLRSQGIRIKYDDRTMYNPGWKYNHWEQKGVPIRIEVGPKDIDEKQARIVIRYNGEKMDMPIEGLAGEIKTKLEEIQKAMFEKALKARDEHIVKITEWKDFVPNLELNNLVLTPWCGGEHEDWEEWVKKTSREESLEARGQDGEDERTATSVAAKTLCIPFDQPELPEGTKCIASGKPATCWVLWGRSY